MAIKLPGTKVKLFNYGKMIQQDTYREPRNRAALRKVDTRRAIAYARFLLERDGRALSNAGISAEVEFNPVDGTNEERSRRVTFSTYAKRANGRWTDETLATVELPHWNYVHAPAQILDDA